jgi:hypothetical protein
VSQLELSMARGMDEIFAAARQRLAQLLSSGEFDDIHARYEVR